MDPVSISNIGSCAFMPHNNNNPRKYFTPILAASANFEKNLEQVKVYKITQNDCNPLFFVNYNNHPAMALLPDTSSAKRTITRNTLPIHRIPENSNPAALPNYSVERLRKPMDIIYLSTNSGESKVFTMGSRWLMAELIFQNV